MDDENEFLTLPDDPEEAFAVLQKRKYRELEAIWQDGTNGSWYAEREYVNVLLAFDEIHMLGLLDKFQSPPSGDTQFADYFQDFRRHVEAAKQKILMEAARRVKGSGTHIIVLDASSRAAIHRLIIAIRDRLNELDLPENKREALFNKLNAFASEVDRNRTRTEAIYAFAIDASRVAREVNKNINPIMDSLNRLFDFVDRAKKWKDALPPWSERGKIGGASKQLPKPEVDDDVPF